jgi:hypothetical protein
MNTENEFSICLGRETVLMEIAKKTSKDESVKIDKEAFGSC